MFGYLGQRTSQKLSETVPHDVTERGGAEGIVAARKRRVLQMQAIATGRFQECVREFGPECRVVAAAHGEDLFRGALQLRNIRKWTDRRPIAPGLVVRDSGAEGF